MDETFRETQTPSEREKASRKACGRSLQADSQQRHLDCGPLPAAFSALAEPRSAFRPGARNSTDRLVKNHGTTLKEAWGARTFIVQDPDGNIILFAGPAD